MYISPKGLSELEICAGNSTIRFNLGNNTNMYLRKKKKHPNYIIIGREILGSLCLYEDLGEIISNKLDVT